MAFTAQCSAINFFLLAKFSSPSTSLWVFHMLFAPCVRFEGIFFPPPERAQKNPSHNEKSWHRKAKKTKEMWMKFWWLGRRKENATWLPQCSCVHQLECVFYVITIPSLMHPLPLFIKFQAVVYPNNSRININYVIMNKTTSRCQNKAHRWAARRFLPFRCQCTLWRDEGKWN